MPCVVGARGGSCLKWKPATRSASRPLCFAVCLHGPPRSDPTAAPRCPAAHPLAVMAAALAAGDALHALPGRHAVGDAAEGGRQEKGTRESGRPCRADRHSKAGRVRPACRCYCRGRQAGEGLREAGRPGEAAVHTARAGWARGKPLLHGAPRPQHHQPGEEQPVCSCNTGARAHPSTHSFVHSTALQQRHFVQLNLTRGLSSVCTALPPPRSCLSALQAAARGAGGEAGARSGGAGARAEGMQLGCNSGECVPGPRLASHRSHPVRSSSAATHAMHPPDTRNHCAPSNASPISLYVFSRSPFGASCSAASR